MRGGFDELAKGCFIAGCAPSIRAIYAGTLREVHQDTLQTQQASDEANKAGVLGCDACESGYAFDVYLHHEQERASVRKMSRVSSASCVEGPGELVAGVVVPGRRGGVRVYDDGGQRGDGAGWANNLEAGGAAGGMPWDDTDLLYVSTWGNSQCVVE